MSEPWARIPNPAAIPDPCDAVQLRILSEPELSLLVRSHLVPGDDREGFLDLWTTIAFNDDLSTSVFDLLESWLETADSSTHPRAPKFRLHCDGAWNRLTRIRDLDSRPAAIPRSGTIAFALAAGIAQHRSRIGSAATEIDRALWASLTQARDRARRGGNSKDWHAAPTFTSQLVAAVQSHRDLTGTPRAADTELWGLLRD